MAYSFFDNVTVGPAKTGAEILADAETFINGFYRSIGRWQLQAPRHIDIEQQVKDTGTYIMTHAELLYGVRRAWLEKSRVMMPGFRGRDQKMKLQVFDARFVETRKGMFEAIIRHLRYATKDSTLRSAVTIFRQRIDGCGDLRVWNNTIIGYAGYEEDGAIIGDIRNLEITKAAQRLGWSGVRGSHDILPIIVQAADGIAEAFNLPDDLVRQVNLAHPNYPWLEQMGLRCHVFPSVSCLRFYCGGLEFSAVPFNGWYMSTDNVHPQRLEEIAVKMGIDTNDTATPAAVWKEKAAIELKMAVLHSFQKNQVAVRDHEFYKTFVGPDELTCFNPTFDFQDHPWTVYNWTRHSHIAEERKSSKNYRFKEIARAVRVSSKFVHTRLPKATILYETDIEEQNIICAGMVDEIFNVAFQTQVLSMEEYDPSQLQYEDIVVVVAIESAPRRPGHPDENPPQNGERIVKALQLLKTNSEKCPGASADPNEDMTKPLKNVRFGVFALGSTSYPNFCSFGKLLDGLMFDLGAERLNSIACGQELFGRQKRFREWSAITYKMACQSLCLQVDLKKTENTVRFRILKPNEVTKSRWYSDLDKLHETRYLPLEVTHRSLTPGDEVACPDTLNVVLSWKNLKPVMRRKTVKFVPGDVIGILPVVLSEITDGLVQKLKNCQHLLNGTVELQLLEQIFTMDGPKRVWKAHPKLPRVSLAKLLACFDVTTPPTQQLLSEFADRAGDLLEKEQLIELSNNAEVYLTWKKKWPNMLQVLEQFPSVEMDAALFVSLLPIQHPRYYCVSSSLKQHPEEVHLTVEVVKFKTEGENGPDHLGLCSNYLNDTKCFVPGFFRSEPQFHLPSDPKIPIVMVGSGIGVAPFRAFWQERIMTRLETGEEGGEALLVFGCRKREMDLYREEKEESEKCDTLVFAPPALSEEPGERRIYVQDRLAEPEIATKVVDIIVNKGGHFYVCGDSTMAVAVFNSFLGILETAGAMTEVEARDYVNLLNENGRYHKAIIAH